MVVKSRITFESALPCVNDQYSEHSNCIAEPGDSAADLALILSKKLSLFVRVRIYFLLHTRIGKGRRT
jgi:hypothetical protein